MKKKLFMGFVTLVFSVVSLFAMTEQGAKKQAELIAEFLHLGRVTVAQSLKKFKINDPNIGDKGFKCDWFVKEINKKFKNKTGIDIIAGKANEKLPEGTMNFLKVLIAGSKKVCEDNQALINTPGIGFKGFIPASYGKQLGDYFKAKTGIGLKQTTLPSTLRNAYNKPDNFEIGILKDMISGKYAKGEIVAKKVDNNLRLMRPIYIKKACLPCHGSPKGAIDVAGRKKEGYKEGDLRGAISVTIPLK
jgi:general secretion pathway protein A